MSDQRYYFQSRLALKFLTECRSLAEKKDRLLQIEEVIKILGRLLKADLIFLASLATAKEAGEVVHTIQPRADLSFNKTAKDYSLFRGKGLGEFTLLGLKHYENRPGKMPPALRGKRIKRYLVSDRLRLLSGQVDLKGPEQMFGDFCLVFAWTKDFSSSLVDEGQLYTTELFSLISEMGAYVINKNLLEIRYIEELSAIMQNTGILAAFLEAQKQAERFQDAQTRQERTRFASNWVVMDANEKDRLFMFNLMNFINMSLKQDDSTSICAVLRAWECN